MEHTMKHALRFGTGTLLVLAILAVWGEASRSATAHKSAYEVWVIDQSDTTPDGGGTLYIYQGDQLNGRDAAAAVPEVIDLGGAARDVCLAQTGSAPRRPHMLMFNGGHGAHVATRPHAGQQSYGILTFVATGHVLFIEAHTRVPVACIDAGAQAHAAVPSPDETHVVVANQNGKLLQRISTDYAGGSFALDNAATIDLATCVTPSGAACQDPVLRPDNAPICPIIDATGRLTFVTLRGGGMLVVDSRTTPMSIVAEYDSATVHPNGCGGVEQAGKMYINAGGGTPANPLESDLYRFRLSEFSTAASAPNTPAPLVIFSHDERGFVDAHGAVLTRNGGRYLWVADRAANRIVVVKTTRDRVVNEIDLVGELSADPAPDLMDIAPSGNRVFVALRGPNPLSANVPGVNNAVGSTPGLGILRVERNGKGGVLKAIVPISHVVDGVELADPHAVAVRVK
jgi:DNA-binding beta-propeller fold protein YncE